jgi:hypothetical protein
MRIHSRYWDHPMRNRSRNYNYYRWNGENRMTAARHIEAKTAGNRALRTVWSSNRRFASFPKPKGRTCFPRRNFISLSRIPPTSSVTASTSVLHFPGMHTSAAVLPTSIPRASAARFATISGPQMRLAPCLRDRLEIMLTASLQSSCKLANCR